MKQPDFIGILKIVCAITAVIGCVSFVIGLNVYEKTNETTAALVADLPYFREFSLPLMGGGTFTQEDLKGSTVTVINGWAPWCGPCVGEMPAFEALSGEYADRGLRVVSIVADYFSIGEDKRAEYDAQIADIIESTGVTYPVMLSDDAFSQSAFITMRHSFPCTWAVDENGNVLGIVSGSHDEDTWREYFEKWLEEAQ